MEEKNSCMLSIKPASQSININRRTACENSHFAKLPPRPSLLVLSVGRPVSGDLVTPFRNNIRPSVILVKDAKANTLLKIYNRYTNLTDKWMNDVLFMRPELLLQCLT